MIKVNKLSYEFPQKELYHKISFTLEDNVHCAFIGTNGTGKSTLVDMIMDPEKYLFDGKIEVKENLRIGYVRQFSRLEDKEDVTVFEYLSEEFLRLNAQINDICEELADTTDMEETLERYQQALDAFQRVDGDNYESNIRKQLRLADMGRHENQRMAELSSGECKLIQIMREMLVVPDLLIMDEPDGYLDFDNLNALMNLINSHKGTMLVITHNRYLLNHCFNKILHLENTEIREFDGSYIDYNFELLQKKIELQELAAADTEEIERNKKLVEKLRADATKFASATRGRALHARVSMLERLEARRVKEPFVEIRQPEIILTTSKETQKEETVLAVTDYQVSFDEMLLSDVNFEVKAGEKVAIVGGNGTGKTTLLRDLYQNQNEAVRIAEDAEVSFLSQMQGETLSEEHTVLEEFLELGFQNREEVAEYLEVYCFDEEMMDSPIRVLSGGEKNLLQLAKIALGDANLLLLDEPTSHLDTYSQMALEDAISAYNGTVLMVSHDFYTIANCMDYILLIDEKTVRKVSSRKFRKMIYANHFKVDYLQLEQKKKELEAKVQRALQDGDFESAKKICEDLETVIRKM